MIAYLTLTTYFGATFSKRRQQQQLLPSPQPRRGDVRALRRQRSRNSRALRASSGYTRTFYGHLFVECFSAAVGCTWCVPIAVVLYVLLLCLVSLEHFIRTDYFCLVYTNYFY